MQPSQNGHVGPHAMAVYTPTVIRFRYTLQGPYGAGDAMLVRPLQWPGVPAEGQLISPVTATLEVCDDLVVDRLLIELDDARDDEIGPMTVVCQPVDLGAYLRELALVDAGVPALTRAFYLEAVQELVAAGWLVDGPVRWLAYPEQDEELLEVTSAGVVAWPDDEDEEDA